MGETKPGTRGAQPVLRRARQLLRRWQAGQRVLPDFLIIGAQKSGTSSLFRYLGQHPQIRGSLPKEVHYFDGGFAGGTDTYTLGEDWYRTHFPLRRSMKPGQVAFEASPLYMLHPLAAGRIAALLPEVKLVAVLRNPTDRALSHYFHNVRNNALRHHAEGLTPMQAMAEEDARLAPILAAADYKNEIFRAFSYKARGRYLEQLERYWGHFPRERLLVLRAEDLFEDPAGLMRELCDFLGIERIAEGLDFAARNVGGNREPVDAETRAMLDAYFAPHNRALYDALGRDFGWEREPPRAQTTGQTAAGR